MPCAVRPPQVGFHHVQVSDAEVRRGSWEEKIPTVGRFPDREQRRGEAALVPEICMEI